MPGYDSPNSLQSDCDSKYVHWLIANALDTTLAQAQVLVCKNAAVVTSLSFWLISPVLLLLQPSITRFSFFVLVMPVCGDSFATVVYTFERERVFELGSVLLIEWGHL